MLRHWILACAMIVVFGVLLHCSSARAQSANHIRNGDFETGDKGWEWQATPAAKANGGLDTSERHTGKASYRLTRQGVQDPHVIAAIVQKVSGLNLNTTYRLTAWVKGNAASSCWIGGWNQRLQLPSGTFNWTQFSMDINSGPDNSPLDILVVADGTTGGLWVDNIELVRAVDYNGARTFPALPRASLLPTMRFYPAPQSKSNVRTPMVAVRDQKDPRFGANVQMRWSDDALHLQLTVLDPSNGAVFSGQGIWQGDSVQIGIDADPLTPKSSYTGSCREFGIAAIQSGGVEVVPLYNGGDENTTSITGTSRRISNGYELDLTFPWKSLGLNAAPPSLAMNVLVNDSQLDGVRRYVEWTYGIGHAKHPGHFAAISMVPAGATVGAGIVTEPQDYDASSFIRGRYFDYAFSEQTEGSLALRAKGPGKEVQMFDNLNLPAVKAANVRELEFEIPSSWLKDEGVYRVHSLLGKTAIGAAGMVRRVDAGSYVKEFLPKLKELRAQLKARWESQPSWRDDRYLQLGFMLAERFENRVIRGGIRGDQTLPWSKLQIRETVDVLNIMKARMDRLDTKTATVYPGLALPSAFRVDQGVLQGRMSDQWRPVYMSGYCGWIDIILQIGDVARSGSNLIEQEFGPNQSFDGEGKPNPDGLKRLREHFAITRQNNIAIELLLSPHYYPDWARKQDPKVDLGEALDLDHPTYRRITEEHARMVVGAVKDQANLFTINLTNEPHYSYSGHTERSRPAWTAYLKQRHGTIDALNNLYGKKYDRFEDVPVPPKSEPRRDKVAERRAYFDWLIFNQQYFAQWHAWLNGIVKDVMPEAKTHIKIINRIFNPATLDVGVDPELFCGITDYAGNDSFAYPHTAGEYSYDWQLGHILYDLLHSFRGQIVFNSENHTIPDRSAAESFPPNFTRSSYWQGGLHHSPATTVWVWTEPPPTKEDDANGSIYLRPMNLYTAGQTFLDMNRWARELSVLNQQKAKVALLYSVPAIFWSRNYPAAVRQAYTDVMFMGQPVTFISEKQLVSGQRSPVNEDVTCLIIPQATHVSDSVVAGLQRFIAGGGNVIAIGEDCLRYDEYQRPRSAGLNGVITLPLSGARSGGNQPLREILMRNGVTAPALLNAKDGSPLWGVEYRAAEVDGRKIIALTNLTREVVHAQWSAGGSAVDLLDDMSPVNMTQIELVPMQPRLLRVQPVADK